MNRLLLLLLAALAACEVLPKREARQDTTTAVPDSAAIAAARGATDTISGAVPATPADSVRMGADTGRVAIWPDRAVRGGVIVAVADALLAESPRCSWKGAPIPCHRSSTGGGIRAIIPLPADAPGGTFTLTIDAPTARISRQVTVADHDFGRELVFLDSAHYALIRRGTDIARDARALRQVLTAAAGEQRWGGAWRDPVQGGGTESGGYGVERFYHRASDASRAIRLEPALRARGAFGGDTTTAAAGDVPAWRHAGVDIAARSGTAVRAPAAGAVVDVGAYTLTGRTLVLDHGQGVHSAFFHLDTVLVRRGDVARAGATVARVGATGLATGPHLHYGIYIHGSDVDPAAWRRAADWLAQNGGEGGRRGRETDTTRAPD
ncbi:MAG: M23 family metallopeptidase [Gemmatimonadota bacterium]|nr:M23 family metallopeptidase [Gemmatimonadota bacterium]